MKNIKLYFFGFVLFLTITDTYGQSTIDDDRAHRRYWFYRARFINDFIKIGKKQGECLVMAERNQGKSPTGVYDTTGFIGPDQIDLANMYLSTLALEYKMLTRNGQNTDETIKEIYHMLYTLNRLDLNAEEFWSIAASLTPTSCALHQLGSANGYMMREDFPRDFISGTFENLTHYNYELLENGYDSTNMGASQKTICGGFSGVPHVNSVKNGIGGKFSKYLATPCYSTQIEVSLVHDKYYSMLASFMFIVKYIPSNTYYYDGGVAQQFQDGTTGIKEQAVAITNRLSQYIAGNVFNGSDPLLTWILHQPDGTYLPLSAGSVMTEYSFGPTRAICHINNGYPWAWTNNCLIDPVALSVGLPFYNGMGGVQPTMDMSVFTAWNQAITNFPVGTFPCWYGMTANTDYWNIEWAELTREVLFQTHTVHASTSKFENPINVAPCAGPYNFSLGPSPSTLCTWPFDIQICGPAPSSYTLDLPNKEWSAPDRTEHPNYQNSYNPPRAFYPGVDFMFLHNLFYEYLNQQNLAGKYDHAVNLMDNYDEQTWPMWSNSAGGLIGTTTAPQNIHVFQNLSSRAQITSMVASQVDYRAGKEIALLPEDGAQPGFSVQDGSEFAAHIQRYLCNGINDYSGAMRAANGTGSPDFETDNMNTAIALHHVDHPLSDSDLHPDANIEPAPDLKNLDRNAESFKIIPNPNSGNFMIITTKISEKEILNLTIIDMKGTVIYEENNFSEGRFDFTNFSKGIYLAKIKSNLGWVNTEKISIAE